MLFWYFLAKYQISFYSKTARTFFYADLRKDIQTLFEIQEQHIYIHMITIFVYKKPVTIR